MADSEWATETCLLVGPPTPDSRGGVGCIECNLAKSCADVAGVRVQGACGRHRVGSGDNRQQEEILL